MTSEATPHFLAHHFKHNKQYDKAALPVLQRLALHQVANHLEVRRRHPCTAIHAKLFIWTDTEEQQGAVVGSSNLTIAGLGVQVELNAHMRKPNSIQYFDAWFKARWREEVSVRDATLLNQTIEAVTD